MGTKGHILCLHLQRRPPLEQLFGVRWRALPALISVEWVSGVGEETTASAGEAGGGGGSGCGFASPYSAVGVLAPTPWSAQIKGPTSPA